LRTKKLDVSTLCRVGFAVLTFYWQLVSGDLKKFGG